MKSPKTERLALTVTVLLLAAGAVRAQTTEPATPPATAPAVTVIPTPAPKAAPALDAAGRAAIIDKVGAILDEYYV
jgi:hypothetical protein